MNISSGGYWEDMVLYWAWRGDARGYVPPPTVKTIVRDGDGVAIAVIDEE